MVLIVSHVAAAAVAAGCPVHVHVHVRPPAWHGQAHGGGERVGDMAEGSGGVWVVGREMVVIEGKVHGWLLWCRW